MSLAHALGIALCKKSYSRINYGDEISRPWETLNHSQTDWLMNDYNNYYKQILHYPLTHLHLHLHLPQHFQIPIRPRNSGEKSHSVKLPFVSFIYLSLTKGPTAGWQPATNTPNVRDCLHRGRVILMVAPMAVLQIFQYGKPKSYIGKHNQKEG